MKETMTLGAQLYTARDYCKNLEDFGETLKKIADIGYTTVQVSGVCEYTPEWLKEQLDKTGLKCVLTHSPVDKLKDQTEEVIRAHKLFDCPYIGLGYYRFHAESETEVEDFKNIVTPFAEAFKKAGKYFMYHNHAFEFKKFMGSTVWEHILEAVPADLMGITLDTYWVQVGGADPSWWIRRLAGRLPCIHLKDCGYKQSMQVVGEGNMNFEGILAAAEEAGTKYLLVEQDDCNGEDPLDCLKRSYNNLRAMGLQ